MVQEQIKQINGRFLSAPDSFILQNRAPHQYLTQCRIEKAKHLLTQPNIQISDIPQQLGFYDQSQFTNTFRKLVGVTPKKYRANLE